MPGPFRLLHGQAGDLWSYASATPHGSPSTGHVVLCHDLPRSTGSASDVAQTYPALADRLTRENCIFSFVASPPEVVADSAVVDNGYLMAHPTHPPLRLAAAPAQFDNELPEIRRPGPEKGEHTREILEQLGYSGKEIEALIASGAVVAFA